MALLLRFKASLLTLSLAVEIEEPLCMLFGLWRCEFIGVYNNTSLLSSMSFDRLGVMLPRGPVSAKPL